MVKYVTFPLDVLDRKAGILEEIEDAFTFTPPVDALFLPAGFRSLPGAGVPSIPPLFAPIGVFDEPERSMDPEERIIEDACGSVAGDTAESLFGVLLSSDELDAAFAEDKK